MKNKAKAKSKEIEPEFAKPTAFHLKNKKEEFTLKHPPALKPKGKRAK